MGQPRMPEVRVNDERISLDAISAEAQNHSAPSGQPGAAWQKAAQALAIRSLLLQEAADRGIEAAPESLDGDRLETPEEAQIRALLEQGVDPAPVTEADCQRIYREHPDQFQSPALYEAAHILYLASASDAAARADAEAMAQAALERLRSKPDAFAEIARGESDCPSSADGGLLGQIEQQDIAPEFGAALAAMAEGDIEGPVATRFGMHIIRLDAKADGAVLPFATVKDVIREHLEKVAWAKAAKTFVGDLVAAADVEGVDLTHNPGPAVSTPTR